MKDRAGDDPPPRDKTYPDTPPSAGVDRASEDDPGLSGDEAARVEDLRRELAAVPAEVVIANHCYGLFELAALHLSDQPPRLEPARLAIDALAAVVEALGPRLGPAQDQLAEALAQIRLAFVQISAAPPGAQA